MTNEKLNRPSQYKEGVGDMAEVLANIKVKHEIFEKDIQGVKDRQDKHEEIMNEYRINQTKNEAKMTQLLETNSDLLKEVVEDNKNNREALKVYIAETNGRFELHEANFDAKLLEVKRDCIDADREQDVRRLENKASIVDRVVSWMGQDVYKGLKWVLRAGLIAILSDWMGIIDLSKLITK